MEHRIFRMCYIILIFISSISCNNNQRIENIMKSMVDNKVDLSELVPIMAERYNHYSTIGTDSSAKLILYLDSSSCSTCVINKLGQYDYFQKKSKYSNGRFLLMIILSVPNGEFNYIKNYIINNKFEYPIYFDKENKFKAKNNFIPNSTFFHSFLLDKNNKIILVGNPVMSDSIWELYIKTIENLLIEQ